MGFFLARVRQARRHMRTEFERLGKRLDVQAFANRRRQWRLAGKKCCRHGVMFTNLPGNHCPCLVPDAAINQWTNARWMPALDSDLKAIVAVPFALDSFRRLASIQAELRSLGW